MSQTLSAALLKGQSPLQTFIVQYSINMLKRFFRVPIGCCFCTGATSLSFIDLSGTGENATLLRVA